MRIALALTDDELRRCFPVVHELRPHLTEPDFLAQVGRQRGERYNLAFAEDGGAIQAVAGYRYLESLAWGKALYVDDLVTASQARSQGVGGALFDWLLAQARAQDCDSVHLESGVQRFGAHRFYLRKRMDITSHHFALKLKP
jgi:GNAT superfamily N-acetyltransferase